MRTASLSESVRVSGTAPPTLRGVDRAMLAHGWWRVGAAHVSTGNRVALLRDGAATFDGMLGLIAEARERVSLESYIVRSDSVGERFAPELIAAARRGVQTRVLFDWIGSRSTTRAFVQRPRSGGVQVRIFNRPSFTRRWFGLSRKQIAALGLSRSRALVRDTVDFHAIQARVRAIPPPKPDSNATVAGS